MKCDWRSESGKTKIIPKLKWDPLHIIITGCRYSK